MGETGQVTWVSAVDAGDAIVVSVEAMPADWGDKVIDPGDKHRHRLGPMSLAGCREAAEHHNIALAVLHTHFSPSGGYLWERDMICPGGAQGVHGAVDAGAGAICPKATAPIDRGVHLVGSIDIVYAERVEYIPSIRQGGRGRLPDVRALPAGANPPDVPVEGIRLS